MIVAALSGLPLVLADRIVGLDAAPAELGIRATKFNLREFVAPSTSFGKLEWRGGVILSANHSAFGGFSGLSLSADGRRMLAVSDRGAWISSSIDYEGGKLTGISDVRIGALLDDSGGPIAGVWENDAEALVLMHPLAEESADPLNGHYLISYEGYHGRLEEVSYRDGTFSTPAGGWDLPDHLGNLEDNKGIEGVAFLRGGDHADAMVAFAERKPDEQGDHTGMVAIGAKSYPLFLKRRDAYDVTALESLADGSLLVLERSFVRSSLKLGIRLRLIAASEIKAGARLDGVVILDAYGRYAIDNFEGMAVSRNEAGETVITLISDDNFNFFQNTILMQFALRPAMTAIN